MKKFAKEFIDFSYESKSVFHVIENSASFLEENNFKKLNFSHKWNLVKGGKYYVTKNDSSLIAFTVGEGSLLEKGFKISGNHTDSPGFRIKPQPEMVGESFLRLNTEVYGGPILNTWLDRPLSLAGRIVIKGESIFSPKTVLVSIDRPILIIPNLAIHQNRGINDGIKLNRQNDTLPVITMVNEKLNKESFLLNLVAKEAGVNPEDILDLDLYLYSFDKGSLVGLNEEFISAPKIDNLAAVFAGLHSIVKAKENTGVNILACFDNEEVGSCTKQGADSNLLVNTLERISIALGYSREDFLRTLSNSFMLSLDGAHSVHPAKGEKTDPTSRPEVNKGVTLKMAANQSYSSDGYSLGVIKQLLKENNIPFQYFVNRSDTPGGSTIGPLSARHLEVNSIDLGLAMVSMHSIRELCGTEDLSHITNLLENYYSL